MAQKTETRWRNSVVVPFLKTLKHTWFTSIQQVSIKGTPDILLCANGRFVGLELKTNEGKLSKLQEYNLECIEKAGGMAIVANPSTWDGIKTFLTHIDRKTNGS